MRFQSIAFGVFIGLAGICLSAGIALIWAERRKRKKWKKKNVLGISLLIFAGVFTVVAVECFIWPRA